MLLALLCGCDTWPVSLRVKVFNNRLLREHLDLKEWKQLEGEENGGVSIFILFFS